MSAPSAGRFVGQSVLRKEDQHLLTGHGQYVDDLTVPGLLHGAFLRSDSARGRITGLSVAPALELSGVVAIYTAADFEGLPGESWQIAMGEAFPVPPPLASTDVRYAGEPVAFVVASSRYVAEDALELIELEIESDPPVVDYSTATQQDRFVHGADGSTSNALMEIPWTVNPADLDDAFATAQVIECTIVQHRYNAVPMEGRGALASWSIGRNELDLAIASQSVHEARAFFARYLQIPAGHVRVTARDVGGGFGQKMFPCREECAVVLASRLLGQPVKWVEDRRENLLSASHSRNEQGVVRLAIDKDQMIQGITVDHVVDIGAFPPAPAGLDPRLLPGPYRIPRLGFSSSLVWTNTMGKGPYRGPWLFETTARELAIDHTARMLGLDPIEIRRRNLLTRGDLPFDAPGGYVFDEISPRETLEQALEILGYEAFRAEQAEARAAGRLVGLGAATYVEPTAMGRYLGTEGATVRVESDGSVMAFVGTTSQGHSIETTMAQVVAETLGVAYSAVTVVQADTQATPYGPGTGGSRTAVVVGGAMHDASAVVREGVLQIAAHQLEASADDLEIVDGNIFVRGTPTRSIALREVVSAARRFSDGLPNEVAPVLEATVRFRPTRFPTWSNATHLCVVEIDPDTCVARIERFIVSEDCGRMINPAVVNGQIFGGVVQGIGGVLLEDFVYDGNGNPLTTTFMDYLLPTTTDVPLIEVGHLETVSTTNPGGYKGVGEGGAIGAHAAVANAIGDALAPHGVHVLSSPLGPNDIHRLLTQAGYYG